MKHPSRSLILFACIALLLGRVANNVFAADWTNPAGGDWTEGSNWNTGTAPNAAGEVADFTGITPTGNAATVTVSGTQTVGQLQFGSLTETANWTVTGGTLNLANIGGGGQCRYSGRHRFDRTDGNDVNFFGKHHFPFWRG